MCFIIGIAGVSALAAPLTLDINIQTGALY